MAKHWTTDEILEMARDYQTACVLTAGADLELYTLLDGPPLPASEIAARRRCDLRGMTALLDALAALGILEKSAGSYSLPPGIADALTPEGRHSVLAMVQHQANCMRRWVHLAHVVRTGQPAPRQESVRGELADHAAFIQAMNDLSGPIAEPLIAEFASLPFTHVLDVGGASGTWTLAWLKANPGATVTLFDLPSVIPMAETRLRKLGQLDRVRLVAGDFTIDPLPSGADLAWVSAIVHQQSRQENVTLYRKIAGALAPSGRILIRDIVMDDTRTQPPGGALFAINMLVGTHTGGTFTLQEFREDLEAAGFTNVRQIRKDPWMNSIVSAEKA